MNHLIGYGGYNDSSCNGLGCTGTGSCGCAGTGGSCGCAGHSGMGQNSEKIAGLTPFAWVMVALAAGTLAYLVGQKD
jgi:hypothetical protein